MKKIKNLFFISCMVAGAFLFSSKNVSAKEFKPDVIGTLTNAGDSVAVKDAGETSKKYIKYVSSTDELMYVYTDSTSKDPIIKVFDKWGNELQTYDDMEQINGEFIDPAKTENYNNSEIFIKLKKGEVYYFVTYLYETEDLVDYNVKLTKAANKPVVTAFACNSEKEYDLSEEDFSKMGVTYDANNYVLTMNNADFPYEIYIYTDSLNIFSDGLFEFKILGNNTISVDYGYFINTRVSTVFTGDGTLNFKTETEGYIPDSYIYALERPAWSDYTSTIVRVDGPTFKMGIITSDSVIEAPYFIMDGGKIIFSGVSDGFLVYADRIYINGGEIDALDGECSYDCISAGYVIEVNGGVVRISLHDNGLKYNCAMFGDDNLMINDGTIFVKYIDPKSDGAVKGYHMLESEGNISINGGNIYVVASDRFNEFLEEYLVGFYEMGDEYDPSTATITISDNANIQKGSTIDMSKVECSLEYDKCVYDGKEKKPVVTVNGLVEGVDYTVAYADNVNPGTAKVTVTGKGDFTGKKEFTFVIEEIKNDDSSVVDGPKEGTTVKDKKYIYKVTKAGSKSGKVVGELMVTGLKKKSLTQIKIATVVTIGGVKYKVTSIGANAFKGNKKITKVTIGKNVKKIGANAFANCKKLKNVRINSKKLKKIGNKAFFKKKGKKITFKVPKAKKKAYKKLIKRAKTKKFVVK